PQSAQRLGEAAQFGDAFGPDQRLVLVEPAGRESNRTKHLRLRTGGLAAARRAPVMRRPFAVGRSLAGTGPDRDRRPGRLLYRLPVRRDRGATAEPRGGRRPRGCENSVRRAQRSYGPPSGAVNHTTLAFRVTARTPVRWTTTNSEYRCMKIGAHVSTADALHRCVDRCGEIGAEAIQIFASAPQSWRPHSHTDEAIALLKAHAGESEIGPVFVHGIYLINLAAENPEHIEKSVTSLAAALRFCEGAGALGTIFHVGSHKGAGFETVKPRIVAAMRDALERAPGESWLILENSAGAGNTLAAKFAEIGELIRETGS